MVHSGKTGGETMSRIIVVLVFVLTGCGTGEKITDSTAGGDNKVPGVSMVLAENPEMLREKVMGMIGEGYEANAALEIIDRYEADLGFVVGERPTSATIADSAAASEVPLYSGIRPGFVGGDPSSNNRTAAASQTSDRIRRFIRNSLSVAMIGLNECYENFSETSDDRFARRGLAHGYIALISEPSPAQKTSVIEKMKVLQEPFLKR